MKNPNNPPCIRNLYCFRKTGCPEKLWNGATGCTAWAELTVPNESNPIQKDIVKGCIDIINFQFQYAQLGLLEGNQRATESFRNGMTEERGGKTVPKINPDIGSLYLTCKERIDSLQDGQNKVLDFFKQIHERQQIHTDETISIGGVDDKRNES